MVAPRSIRRWLPLALGGLTACLHRSSSETTYAELQQDKAAQCEAGNLEACRWSEEGMARLRQECDGGNTKACWELAFGARDSDDSQTAATYFGKACEHGDGSGCLLAVEQLVDEEPKHRERINGLLTMACEDPAVAEGCLGLAEVYDEGRGVPADLPRARALATRACEGEFARGCVQLGFYAINGLGGEADPEGAKQAFARACELDDGTCGWSEFLDGKGPVGVFGQFMGDPKEDGIVVRVGPSAVIAEDDEVSVSVSSYGQRMQAWYTTVEGVVTSYEDGLVRIVDTSNIRVKVNMVPRGFVVLTTPAAEAEAAAPKPLLAAQLEPWSRGKLELESIESVITAHASELRDCYEGASKEDLEGRAAIDFTIGPRGTVAVSRLVAEEFVDDGIAQCMRIALDGWTFPTPADGGIVIVHYVFSRP